MALGLFGSASETKQTTTNQAFNAGFSEVAGPATNLTLSFTGKTKVGKGGTLSPVVNFTDFGAIKAAQDLAGQAIAGIEGFGQQLNAALAAAIGNARATSSEAVSAVTESQRSEPENIALNAIKWGAIVLAAYFAARIFTKGAH